MELVKQMAHDYMVPHTDESLDKIKDAAPEGILHYFKEQAKSLYPTWSEHIDNGIAPAHIAVPYDEIKKATLGPHAVFDPIGDVKDRQALQGERDDKGRPVPKTLDQYVEHLKSHPGYGWEYTQQAHDMADNFVSHMRDEFGR